MARIFISYRRGDAPGHVGRLSDHFAEQWGWEVFRDREFPHGVEFRSSVESELASADVVLAVIGDRWATTSEPAGHRRIDDPNDCVRRELEVALAKDVLVVPVLVGGASMPAAADLPPSLRELSRRQAVELTDRSWDSDLERLVSAVSRRTDAPTEGWHAPGPPARDSESARPPGPPVGDDDDDPWWRRSFVRGRRRGGS